MAPTDVNKLITDLLTLPFKVLVKSSEAKVTIGTGAHLLADYTIGIYATAVAEAFGRSALSVTRWVAAATSPAPAATLYIGGKRGGANSANAQRHGAAGTVKAAAKAGRLVSQSD